MSIPGPSSVLGNVPGPSLARSTPPGFSVATLPPGTIPIAPVFITVSFGGSGVFTASAVAGDSAFADFTSNGDLDVVIIEHDSRLVGLSAAGVLDLDVVEVEVVAVEFDASSVLDVRVFDGVNVVDVDVSFTGEAVTGFGVVEVETADVVFDGAGVVDVGVVPQFDAVMAAAGGANLTIQSIEVEISPANYESMGTLSFDVETVYVVPVEFTGAGTLSVDSVAYTLKRQRMNKNARQQLADANSWTAISSWTSDSTYPATISGDGLAVAGSGDSTVNLAWTLDTAFSTVWNVRVLRNGNVVYTSPNRSADGLYTESFSLTVSNGDVLTVQAQRGTNSSSMYFDVPSYLEVVPV